MGFLYLHSLLGHCATGPAFSAAGLAWSAGALAGVAGTSLLAAPVLPRLGALAVTVYACALAGLLLLAAAVVARVADGPPILATPTPAQLAALAYLTIAVTALVFIAWYGALERLGVDRTGLFNGLIPVTSLAAVALTGTGTITPPGLLGALAVLAGVILGLSPAPQAHARTVNQAGQARQNLDAERASSDKAILSPMTAVGMLVLPDMTAGISEASATYRPSIPCTRPSASTTESGSLAGPILQLPTGW